MVSKNFLLKITYFYILSCICSSLFVRLVKEMLEELSFILKSKNGFRQKITDTGTDEYVPGVYY